MSQTILIFSDTHLTERPDERKLQFLLQIVARANTVIINGDFWDSYLTTAKRFVESPHWQPLFQALKEKKAICLFGNHDPETACQGVEHIFSTTQALSYDFTQKGQKFHAEHGNRIVPRIDERHPQTPVYLRFIGSLADNALTLIARQYFLRHYKIWNNRMKKWQRESMASNTYLICGHSHFAELSDDPLYVNSGSIRGRLASFILIEDGVPSLVYTDY